MDRTHQLFIAVRPYDDLVRTLYRYIYLYLHEHHPEVYLKNLSKPEDRLDIRRYTEDKPDVIIAHLNTPEVADLLAQLDVPIVNTSGIFPESPYPRVSPDNVRIGEMVGEFLLQRGAEHFVYVGIPQHGYSIDRLAGLQDKVGEVAAYLEMASLPTLPTHRPDWTEFAEAFRETVINLPLRTAFVTANDNAARVILDALKHTEGIQDKDFMVLSCHGMESSLVSDVTSMRLPEQAWGEAAAKLAVQVSRGETVPPEVRLEPLGIVEKASTQEKWVEDDSVAAALNFIRTHLKESIYVPDVVEHAGVSRRVLERRFQEKLGRSIHDHIQQSRLESAQLLLKETDEPLQRVAELSGFTDDQHLRRVCQKLLGRNPGDIRNGRKPTAGS